MEQLLIAFQQTMSGDQTLMKKGEETLRTFSQQKGFENALIAILSQPEPAPGLQVSVAIYLKNHIKKIWSDSNLADDIVRDVHTGVIPLMFTAKDSVARQIMEAIVIMAKVDFPQDWTELLPDLVQRMAAAFQSADLPLLVKVLRIVAKILKPYRSMAVSKTIIQETVTILKIIQEPLRHLFNLLCNDNMPLTAARFTALRLCVEIFTSLTVFELCDFFVDNLREFMLGFNKFLGWTPDFIRANKLPREIFESAGSDRPGEIFRLQRSIVNSLTNLVSQYDSDFLPYAETFMGTVWALTLGISKKTRFDRLAIAGMDFFSAIAGSSAGKCFANGTVLKDVCEKIIVPNMMLSEETEELFEDSPREYIQRDIEGSDSYTRKHSALKLVVALKKSLEDKVIEYLSVSVNALMGQYQAGMQAGTEGAYKSLDAAISLVCALAIRSTSATTGIVEVSPKVPLREFFLSQVASELQKPNSGNDVSKALIKADAIKFVTIFRAQFVDGDFATAILNLLVNALSDENFVVYTYAANAIERILSLKKPDGTAKFDYSFIYPVQGPLIGGLFKCLGITPSGIDLSENEYVIKALLRCSATLDKWIAQISGEVINPLMQVLRQVCAKPVNPTFNHYLFETLVCISRNIITNNPDALATVESTFLPIVEGVLTGDVVEFFPYVFQLLTTFIELTPAGKPINAVYANIFPIALNRQLWEGTGTVPSLCSFVQGYISHSGDAIVRNNQIAMVLGIYQFLLVSNATVVQSYDLLSAVTTTLSAEALNQYMPAVFNMAFTKLKSGRRNVSVRPFTLWLFRMILRHGFAAVMAWTDAVQAGILTGLLKNMIAPWMQGMVQQKDIQLVVGGVRKLCLQSTELFTIANGIHVPTWMALVAAIINLIHKSLTESASAAMSKEVPELPDDMEVSTVGSSSSRLLFAVENDLTGPLLRSANVYTATSLAAQQAFIADLKTFVQGNPNVQQTIQQNMPAEDMAKLMKLMQ